jgi:hypothetical protein
MTKAAAERLTWFIAALGAVVSVAITATQGAWAGASAAAGVAIALANWFVLKLIVDRLLGGSIQRQAGLAIVLIAKMGAFMAAVYLLLMGGYVLPIPFTFGVSTLMAGPLLGSLVHVLMTPKTESERADAAR